MQQDHKHLVSSVDAREAAITAAPEKPDLAFRLAQKIPDPWYRAQGFAWVARFALAPVASEAFDGARAAAALGKDAYQQAAVLSWPIRAALETDKSSLAGSMLADACATLPRISLFCSRAEAVSLLFQAGFVGGPDFWKPVLTGLHEFCPPESHWRAARLSRDIAAILASSDKGAAKTFIEAMPAGKARDHALRDQLGGRTMPARPFFWT